MEILRTNMEHRGKNKHFFRVCFLTAILFLIGAEILYSNYALMVTRYNILSDKVIGEVRVVFLTDLHGREFGAGNSRLLDRITVEKPDLIALVGDIFNQDADEHEIDRMCWFIQRASAIAPVYFGLGNHEMSYLKAHGTDLLGRIQQSGAVVLESDFLDVEINDTPFRIGGYMAYYRQPRMLTTERERIESEIAFAEEFESTDRFKLLLNHIPTAWLDWNCIYEYPVDLVLSGHYHGGLIRIPVLEQGLVAPDVGFFPPYTKGVFSGSEATCILGTGLAGSRLPRFFNPPEIAVVDILPEK